VGVWLALDTKTGKRCRTTGTKLWLNGIPFCAHLSGDYNPTAISSQQAAIDDILAAGK
jgi:hypothetical protein